MKTWGIYTWVYGVKYEIAEFKNKEDAERASFNPNMVGF